MKTALALIALLLVGCASMPPGIEASPEELEACKNEGCSVWTKDELERLFKAGIVRGFLAGRSKGT